MASFLSQAKSAVSKATRRKRAYKLSYFSGRGLAECARLVFAVAEEPFEDFRFKDNWPEHKPRFTFKKVPVLELDGKIQICQSRAIERFLAKTFDLYGSSDLEVAEIEQFTEQINDIRSAYMVAREKDNLAKELGKEAAAGEGFQDKYFSTRIHEEMALLESVQSKSSSKDYFVGSKLSLIDIQFFALCEFGLLSTFPKAKENFQKALDNAPTLHAIYKRVGALPQIVAHIAKRPPSEF